MTQEDKLVLEIKLLSSLDKKANDFDILDKMFQTIIKSKLIKKIAFNITSDKNLIKRHGTGYMLPSSMNIRVDDGINSLSKSQLHEILNIITEYLSNDFDKFKASIMKIDRDDLSINFNAKILNDEENEDDNESESENPKKYSSALQEAIDNFTAYSEKTQEENRHNFITDAIKHMKFLQDFNNVLNKESLTQSEKLEIRAKLGSEITGNLGLVVLNFLTLITIMARNFREDTDKQPEKSLDEVIDVFKNSVKFSFENSNITFNDFVKEMENLMLEAISLQDKK